MGINKRTKPFLKMTCDSWKLDETYVKIKGVWHYLYRAINKEVNTLNWMLSVNRNKPSETIFFNKLLGNKHAIEPKVINVDKSPTFPPALSDIQVECEALKRTKLRTIKYLKIKESKMITRVLNQNQDISSGINHFLQHEIHLMELKPCV